MSIGEAERLGLMREIDKKKLTLQEASEELNLSLRQVKRLRKRYREEGEIGLTSRKRGRPSNRKISEATRSRVLELMEEVYVGFGPTLASEKLKERDGITISAETAREWLIEAGLWTSKRRKAGKVYQRRMRRSRFGELLQGDGSPHDWFEGRGERCVLLQFVDDATGITTVARFVSVEDTAGYLELLKQHLERYGRPLAIYVDKHAVFRVNREEIQKGMGSTHFGQVLKELEIKLICAHSPQAKGRVERKNGVLQDRLIKEMRLEGISSIEEANAFLPSYLGRLNKKFGKAAANPEDAHRGLRAQDDLERIFARKETRKLSKDLTFQYRGTLYMIQTKSPNRMRYATVAVIQKRDGTVEVEYRGIQLKYKKWSEKEYEQPRVLDSKAVEAMGWVNRKTPKPGRYHPWR